MNAEPTRSILETGAGGIELIARGNGPLLVLWPSAARDSEDFDAIATAFGDAGLRVRRPQPRGMGRSSRPLDGLTLHD